MDLYFLNRQILKSTSIMIAFLFVKLLFSYFLEDNRIICSDTGSLKNITSNEINKVTITTEYKVYMVQPKSLHPWEENSEKSFRKMKIII